MNLITHALHDEVVLLRTAWLGLASLPEIIS